LASLCKEQVAISIQNLEIFWKVSGCYNGKHGMLTGKKFWGISWMEGVRSEFVRPEEFKKKTTK